MLKVKPYTKLERAQLFLVLARIIENFDLPDMDLMKKIQEMLNGMITVNCAKEIWNKWWFGLRKAIAIRGGSAGTPTRAARAAQDSAAIAGYEYTDPNISVITDEQVVGRTTNPDICNITFDNLYVGNEFILYYGNVDKANNKERIEIIEIEEPTYDDADAWNSEQLCVPARHAQDDRVEDLRPAASASSYVGNEWIRMTIHFQCTWHEKLLEGRWVVAEKDGKRKMNLVYNEHQTTFGENEDSPPFGWSILTKWWFDNTLKFRPVLSEGEK